MKRLIILLFVFFSRGERGVNTGRGGGLKNNINRNAMLPLMYIRGDHAYLQGPTELGCRLFADVQGVFVTQRMTVFATLCREEPRRCGIVGKSSREFARANVYHFVPRCFSLCKGQNGGSVLGSQTLLSLPRP